eukprot:TRINITY_DN2152_c0_g1_i2.p1 TRINITY_DN2152_c0_g1~~TRINITY_DN2152_c0_g1_i2.p1  ORF type:complete len:171 (+),score=35.86 TRINITY_DN2152_c0_g1_i2:292-804(+)
MSRPAAGGPGGGLRMAPGGPAGPVVTPVAGLGTSCAAVAQLQRQLQQRADQGVTTMLDNFVNMTRTAKMNDPVRNSQEAYQMSIHGGRVVAAAKSLLDLISELKQRAVFTDFVSLNKEVAEHKAECEENARAVEKSLVDVWEAASAALRELADHYYAHKESAFSDGHLGE